jgi:hypothetical protein
MDDQHVGVALGLLGGGVVTVLVLYLVTALQNGVSLSPERALVVALVAVGLFVVGIGLGSAQTANKLDSDWPSPSARDWGPARTLCCIPSVSRTLLLTAGRSVAKPLCIAGGTSVGWLVDRRGSSVMLGAFE